jgi:hypothetical protein
MIFPTNVAQVVAYRCTHPGCRKRAYTTAKSAERHAKLCIHNPIQKTCATCEHDIGMECMKGLRPDGTKLVFMCPVWSAWDGNESRE